MGFAARAHRALPLLLLLIAGAAAPALAQEVPTFQDDFNGVALDPAWTAYDGYAVENPGDTGNHAVIGVTGSGHLQIQIPPGAEHNQFFFRHAQVQRAYEGSGAYEVKFEGPFALNQQFGLAFQSSPSTLMHFMLYADAKIYGYVERQVDTGGGATARATFPGAGTSGFDTGLVPTDPGPLYIRVILADDLDPTLRTWKFEWSRDGTFWTTVVEGVLETAALGETIGVISQVGVFAGSQFPLGSSFDATFDYWRTQAPADIPLPIPVDLLIDPNDGQNDLSWRAETGVDGYRIYRSNTPGGPHTLHDTSATPSYSDPSLVNGTTYVYEITSYTATKESLPSAEVMGIPHALPSMPGVPAGGRIMTLIADELGYQLADGSPVTSWTDAFDTGLDASADPASAPTFVDAVHNTHAAVRFDGIDDFLALASGFSDFTGGMSIFMALEPASVANGSKFLLLGNGASNENIVLSRDGSGAGLQYFTTDSGGAVLYFSTSDALIDGQLAAFSVLQQPGPADTVVSASVSKNGTVVGSGTVYSPPVAPRALSYVGKSYWPDDLFHGDVVEIILYDRTVTAPEEVAILDYLDQKYAFPDDPPPPPDPPPAPTGLVSTTLNQRVDLFWNAEPAADNYGIYRATTPGGPYGFVTFVTATSYSDTPLVNESTYYHVVTASNVEGESGVSNEVASTPHIPPMMPGVPTAGRVLVLEAGELRYHTTDGGPVTYWPDAFGSLEQAVAPLVTAPTWVEDGISGQPVVRFDGVDDFLSIVGSFEDYTGGLSLFVVLRPSAEAQGSKFFTIGNDGGADAVMLGRSEDSDTLQYVTFKAGSGVSWFVTAAALANGTTVALSVVQDSGPENSAVSATASLNGDLIGSGNVWVPPVTPRLVNYIGASYFPDDLFEGDIAEIVLYDRTLDAAEAEAVNTYLDQKYDVTVPPSGAIPSVGALGGIAIALALALGARRSLRRSC